MDARTLLLALVGLVALIFVIAFVALVVWLVRRRARARQEAPRVVEERALEARWRRRVAADQRAIERGRGRPRRPRRWLILGGDLGELRGLLGEPGGAREGDDQGLPERPRWRRRGPLTLVELPWTLATLPELRRRRRGLLRRLGWRGEGRLPFHGVLLHVSLQGLDPADPGAASQLGRGLARALAAWLDEARIDAPVLLVLTGAETLSPGSAELLTRPAPLPPGGLLAAGEPASTASAALLDRLLGELAEHLLPAAANTPSVGAARLISARRALAERAPAIIDMVEETCERGQRDPRPLRGIFLLGRAPGLDPAALLDRLLPALGGEARRRPAGRGRAALSYLAAGLALAAAIAGHLAWGEAQADDRRRLAALRDAVEEVADAPRPSGAELIALLERPSSAQGPLARLRRDPSGLAEALDLYLQEEVDAHLVEPAIAAIERRLRERIEAEHDAPPRDLAAFTALARDLDRYLRLSAPSPRAACRERPLTPADLDEVDADPARDRLLDRIPPRPLAALHDRPLALQIERALATTPSEAVIAWIADDLAARGDLPAIDRHHLGAPGVFTATRRSVAGAFTRRGWPVVQRRLDDLAALLACTDGDPIALRERLEIAQRRAHRAAWEGFVDDLALRRPRDLADAAALVDALADPSAPLSALQGLVREHLEIADPRAAPLTTLIDGAIAGRPPTADRSAPAASLRSFTDFGLGAFHERVAALARDLAALADDPSAAPSVRQALAAAIADTRAEIAAAVADPRGRARLERLLVAPLEAIAELLDDNAGERLREAWCARVADPLRALLIDRYPWSREAREEVDLAALDRLLHPQSGELVAFLGDELAPWVTIEGSRVVVLPRGRGDRRRLAPELVAFLEAALAAGDALYDGEAIAVDLTIGLACTPSIHQVALDLGGEGLHYACAGDPATRVIWPGEREEGLLLEIHGRGGIVQRLRRHGRWALWRLIDGAAEVRARGDALEARIDLSSAGLGEAPITLSTSPSHRALLDPRAPLGPLRDPALLPPRRLFAGQEACPVGGEGR
ncbi:MAG: hypothetical protein H6711_10055 [Myxococcales bacterium]|nr:hypothetical protein [Myxococcales bacterium]